MDPESGLGPLSPPEGPEEGGIASIINVVKKFVRWMSRLIHWLCNGSLRQQSNRDNWQDVSDSLSESTQSSEADVQRQLLRLTVGASAERTSFSPPPIVCVIMGMRTSSNLDSRRSDSYASDAFDSDAFDSDGSVSSDSSELPLSLGFSLAVMNAYGPHTIAATQHHDSQTFVDDDWPASLCMSPISTTSSLYSEHDTISAVPGGQTTSGEQDPHRHGFPELLGANHYSTSESVLENFPSSFFEPEGAIHLLSSHDLTLTDDTSLEPPSTDFAADTPETFIQDRLTYESIATGASPEPTKHSSALNLDERTWTFENRNDESLYINPALITRNPAVNAIDGTIDHGACGTNRTVVPSIVAKSECEVLSKGQGSQEIVSNDEDVLIAATVTTAAPISTCKIDTNGQQVFSCSGCDFSANSLKKCNRHIKRTHCKSYHCDVCKSQGRVEAFGLPSDLRRHVKQCHRVERPYQCSAPQCVRSFPRKDNLIRHVRNVHKREKTSIQP